METSEMVAFVKVVQSGSFTRAAAGLGTQKAWLSRVVSGLETKLGVQLLVRTTRSLSLTEVGREIFERSVAILAALDDVERVAQNVQGRPHGVLKLTCGVEFGMIAVNRWISGYLERFPAMRVEADYTGRIVDIVHEGLDLAIRLGALADSSLTARKLGDVHYALFASPSYLARQPGLDIPADLARHDLVVFNGGSHGNWRLTRGNEETKIGNAARFKVNNILAVRDVVVQGLGIGQLPLALAEPEVAACRLVPVLEDWRSQPTPVYAVFPSVRYLTPKVRAFIDYAVNSFDVIGPRRS